MDKKALDKQLKSDVKPGTESIAINEAQSSANQIVAERSNNLAQERAIATSSATHDSELRAALELGASNGPANVVQPRMMNNRVAQSSQLRPETQEVLSKYGINPSLKETNRSSSNSKVTRVTGSTTNVQQGNQQSQQPIRVTNTTNNNVTNVTNNTTTINTKVDSGKMVAPQAPVVPQITTVAPQANDGKFKAFLNNLFSKRELEKKAQEREWRKRDFELKKYAERVTRRMQDIGNQFAKRMDPALMGQSTGKQIKGILALAGLTILPAYLPKVIELLEKGKDLISGGFGKLSEIFSSDGTFLNKVGETISVGWNKVSQSIAEVMGGKNGETLGDVIGEKVVQFLGGDPEKGDTLLNTLETVGNNIAERISEKMELIFNERSDAVKSVLESQDWGFDWKKNLSNLGELIAAGFGGWESVAKIAGERMQKESADYFRGEGVVNNNREDLIEENTDKKGNIVDNGNKGGVSAMNAYMSGLKDLESDSDNNSDKIAFALQKSTDYDLKTGSYDKSKTGLPRILGSELEALMKAYSSNEEEFKEMNESSKKALSDLIESGEVLKSSALSADLFGDDEEVYRFNKPGSLSEFIKLVTKGRFDPDRSYNENESVLRAIRSFKMGTRINWSSIPSTVIDVLPTVILKSLPQFSFFGNDMNRNRELFKSIYEAEYTETTLSPTQELSEMSERKAKQYSSENKKYQDKYAGRKFFKIHEDQQGKTAEIADQAHRNYVEKINEYADYVPGLGPNTLNPPEKKSGSSGSSGSNQGSGQQPKKEKKSSTGSAFGDVTKSTPESHPDETATLDLSSVQNNTYYIPGVGQAGQDIDSNQGGGVGTITGPITDEERARRVPYSWTHFSDGTKWTKEDSKASAKYIMNWLRGKGLTSAQAAGIVGVIYNESSCNPRAVNEQGVINVGYKGADKGICQWTLSRDEDFVEWYKKRFNTDEEVYPNETSLDTQLEYMWQDMKGPNRTGFWKALEKSASIKDPLEAVVAAADAMYAGYENGGPGLASRDKLDDAYGSDKVDEHIANRRSSAKWLYELYTGNQLGGDIDISKLQGGLGELGEYNKDWNKGIKSSESKSSSSSFMDIVNSIIGKIGDTGKYLYDTLINFLNGDDGGETEETTEEVSDLTDTKPKSPDLNVDFYGNPLEGTEGYDEYISRVFKDQSAIHDKYNKIRTQKEQRLAEAKKELDILRGEIEVTDPKDPKLGGLRGLERELLMEIGSLESELSFNGALDKRMLAELEEIENKKRNGDYSRSLLSKLAGDEEEDIIGTLFGIPTEYLKDFYDPVTKLMSEESMTYGLRDSYDTLSGNKPNPLPDLPKFTDLMFSKPGMALQTPSGVSVSSPKLPTSFPGIKFPEPEEVKEAEETATPANNILNTNNGNSVNNFNTVVNNDNRSIEEIRGRSSLTETSLRH